MVSLVLVGGALHTRSLRLRQVIFGIDKRRFARPPHAEAFTGFPTL
jgi:hypothetical protein